MKPFSLSALLPMLGLFCLPGCQSRAWRDAWLTTPAPEGLAWHNEAWQQTVFDTNGDGRIDRLRFWGGSGTAEEFIDANLDGWFDSHLAIVYGEVRERKQVHIHAPAVPILDSAGAFERPK